VGRLLPSTAQSPYQSPNETRTQRMIEKENLQTNEQTGNVSEMPAYSSRSPSKKKIPFERNNDDEDLCDRECVNAILEAQVVEASAKSCAPLASQSTVSDISSATHAIPAQSEPLLTSSPELRTSESKPSPLLRPSFSAQTPTPAEPEIAATAQAYSCSPFNTPPTSPQRAQQSSKSTSPSMATRRTPSVGTPKKTCLKSPDSGQKKATKVIFHKVEVRQYERQLAGACGVPDRDLFLNTRNKKKRIVPAAMTVVMTVSAG